MRLLSKIQRCLGGVFHTKKAKTARRLVTIRPGSSNVWPSTLYKKMTVTGERQEAPAISEKLSASEERSDRGMLFITGAPCLPKKEPRMTHTANTLMVNTADHPSYYDLQVDYNPDGCQIWRK